MDLLWCPKLEGLCNKHFNLPLGQFTTKEMSRPMLHVVKPKEKFKNNYMQKQLKLNQSTVASFFLIFLFVHQICIKYETYLTKACITIRDKDNFHKYKNF